MDMIELFDKIKNTSKEELEVMYLLSIARYCNLKDKICKINYILNNQMNYREFIDVINDIEDILKENK